MRLVSLKLRGFRRFEKADINFDAPVVALVGPNESGKTSLLDALIQTGWSSAFAERDMTRDAEISGTVQEMTYRLDEGDLHALVGLAPEVPDIRWLNVRRRADGRRTYTVSPFIRLGPRLMRTSHLSARKKAISLAQNETLPDHLRARMTEAATTLAQSPTDYTEDQLALISALSSELQTTDVDENSRFIKVLLDNCRKLLRLRRGGDYLTLLSRY